MKIVPKNRPKINNARISLGIVKALDSYIDFVDYVNMSKS